MATEGSKRKGFLHIIIFLTLLVLLFYYFLILTTYYYHFLKMSAQNELSLPQWDGGSTSYLFYI